MEIFLLPPFGLGGKFEFSLCTQTRTEKLPRGGKIGRGGIRSRKFRSSLFKGLQVSKGQSPLFAQGTDSYAFSQLLKPSKSGIPKKLTHFRLALDAVRSEKGEFPPQSGGLWGKEGKPCKRERPLKALPIR